MLRMRAGAEPSSQQRVAVTNKWVRLACRCSAGSLKFDTAVSMIRQCPANHEDSPGHYSEMDAISRRLGTPSAAQRSEQVDLGGRNFSVHFGEIRFGLGKSPFGVEQGER